MIPVDNAIIMAAGTSSRFAPLSYEIPKGLITVRGEVLIERQIRQLKEAGISDIYVVTGYKKEQFAYLEERFGVILVENMEYMARNNHSSLYVVKEQLKNTYICSSDNYFSQNPFRKEEEHAYYSAVYAKGETKEWCLRVDDSDCIVDVSVGGKDSWVMLGHVFFDQTFSKRFTEILEAEYDLPETSGKLWEAIYADHIDALRLYLKRYDTDMIFEFDTLDELRAFDPTYVRDTRSAILKTVAKTLHCKEKDLVNLTVMKNRKNEASGFSFLLGKTGYSYRYMDHRLRRLR